MRVYLRDTGRTDKSGGWHRSGQESHAEGLKEEQQAGIPERSLPNRLRRDLSTVLFTNFTSFWLGQIWNTHSCSPVSATLNRKHELCTPNLRTLSHLTKLYPIISFVSLKGNLGAKMALRVEYRSQGEGLIWSLVDSLLDQGEQRPTIPQVDLSEGDMPVMFGKKRMPVLIFSIVYACYWWVRPDGRGDDRLLVWEELQAILSNFNTDVDTNEGQVWSRLMEQLERDSSDKSKLVFETLEDQKKEALTRVGELLFRKLLEDPGHRERHENLRGLYV